MNPDFLNNNSGTQAIEDSKKKSVQFPKSCIVTLKSKLVCPFEIIMEVTNLVALLCDVTSKL